MKNMLMLLLLFFAIGNYADVKVVSVAGVVQTKKSQSDSWQSVKEGDVLSEGNFIFTGFNSSALLTYNTIKIEVKPLSQLVISSLLSDNKNTVTDIYLKYGQIKSDVKKIENYKTNFKIRSANTTASVRGTSFIFGNDILIVENGTVRFESELNDSSLVQKGEKIEYSSLLNLLVDNYMGIYSDYERRTSPLGLFDSEDVPAGFDLSSGDSARSSIMIHINVIK